MAPLGAEPRRRSCYATSRLLRPPQLRLQQPPWRRPPPLPGVAGITTALAGAALALSLPARLIMDTAAATCGGWRPLRGDLVGAWSTAAIEAPSAVLRKPRPSAGA